MSAFLLVGIVDSIVRLQLRCKGKSKLRTQCSCFHLFNCKINDYERTDKGNVKKKIDLGPKKGGKMEDVRWKRDEGSSQSEASQAPSGGLRDDLL